MRLLHSPVREFAWGSPTAIPELLGLEPSGAPQAEMWIGAHPAAPSTVEVEGEEIPLDQYIAGNPEYALGAEAAKAYGALPFLTKLLAAERTLSLQVHPSIEQAQTGFEAEEAAGIPVDAPTRSYRDRNHKPEMIVALTEFDALSGFRSPAETSAMISALLGELPEDSSAAGVLSRLRDLLEHDDEAEALRSAFEFALSGEDSGSAAAEVAARLSGRDLHSSPLKEWTAELETFVGLTREYPNDPGALVSLLVNRVRLEPGEAIYLPAGNLHAYLRGFGVEVMATSDNVLRGGLTPKHIDVAELKKTLLFEALPVPYCRPERVEFSAGFREIFEPPFDEFSVERITFTVDGVLKAEPRGAAVVLVTEGSTTVDGTSLRQGQSGFLSAEEPNRMIAATAGTVVFLITGSRTPSAV